MLSFRLFLRDLSLYKKMMTLSFVLFAVGIVLGAAGSESILRLVAPQLEAMQQYSRELSGSEIPELSFFKFIFMNNAVKSVAIIAFGAFLGLVPVIFLVMNGMVLGLVVSLSAAEGANVFELIVLGLLPHGIIEIPVILIAAAYGLQFGYLVLKSIGELGAREREERTVVWGDFLRSAVRGAFWIIVLLLIAAVIESTVTYHLVR